MLKAIIASAALLFCLSGAAIAAEEPPACATFDMVKAHDLELLRQPVAFAAYDQVLVADLTGLPAKNALFIMTSMGAPKSAMEGERVVIFTGQPPVGSDGDKIGDAHLYVFDVKGCMMGGTSIPMTMAQSFAGLGA